MPYIYTHRVSSKGWYCKNDLELLINDYFKSSVVNLTFKGLFNDLIKKEISLQLHGTMNMLRQRKKSVYSCREPWIWFDKYKNQFTAAGNHDHDLTEIEISLQLQGTMNMIWQRQKSVSVADTVLKYMSASVFY